MVYCTGLVPCLSKSEAIGDKQQSAEALAEAEKSNNGGVAEWFKAIVLKTIRGDEPLVSSNLTPTAQVLRLRSLKGDLWRIALGYQIIDLDREGRILPPPHNTFFIERPRCLDKRIKG